MTPQQLIDLKGYGSAMSHLIKTGKWDEYAGMKSREFSVKLEATVTIEDTIVVTARHKDEAEKIACDKFSSLHDADEDDIEVNEVNDSLED